MYSGSIARVYSAPPDPLEHDTPKRVVREEQHLGEMLASTKKRVTWRFTLGESDRMHDVVLLHSVMSHKKLVHFDGRQVHFSSTKMVGDWCFSMILDGLKMDVRIRELETADVPKYDLVANRIPFRRWDVYRRKKRAVAMTADVQSARTSGSAYGTQHWGPDGATPSRSQNESQQNTGSPMSHTRERGAYSLQDPYASKSPTSGQTQCVSAPYRASSGQSDGRTCSYAGHTSRQHSTQQAQSNLLATNRVAANTHPQQRSARAASKSVKRPEVNLIDDFGPSVSVSAHSLTFDPLARAKMSSTKDPAASTACQRPQHPAPLSGAGLEPSTCVDPFAPVAPPAVAKPAAVMSTHAFAAPGASSYQQHQQQQLTRQMGAGTLAQVAGYQQRLMVGMAMGAPMGGAIAVQQRPGARGFYAGQQPAVAGGMGTVNYNNDITQLMNPASLATSHRKQEGKCIDIDAFAGISR